MFHQDKKLSHSCTINSWGIRTNADDLLLFISKKKGVIMGFFKLKKDKREYTRIVLSGGPETGKTTMALKLSHSPLLAPIAFIGTEGGSKFLQEHMAPGSERIEIEDLVEARSLVNQLTKGADKMPFKSIVLDTWVSLFRRFNTAYDEKQGKTEGIRTESQFYDEKSKTYNDWGKIKTPFTRMLCEIMYLPANIIFTTWTVEEIDQYQRPTGIINARIDDFTEHMCDTVIILDPHKVKRVQKDRSKIVKVGMDANVELIEKIANKIQSMPVESSENEQETDTTETSSEESACEECGTAVKAAIAKVSASKTNGKILCLKCLKNYK